MTDQRSSDRSDGAMSRVQRSAVFQVILVLVLVATTVAGGYLALDKVRVLNDRVNENAIWLMSRLEVEHQDYMLAVQRAALSSEVDRTVLLGKVVQTFDIYYSRVETTAAFVRERSLDTRSARAIADQLEAIIAYRGEVAGLIDNSQGIVALLPELVAMAEAIAPSHRDITVSISLSRFRAEQQERERTERELWAQAGRDALLIVLLGTLVVLLIRINGRLKSHVARARAARDKLQGIINVAPSAIVLTDAKGQIRELNNVAASLLGLSCSEATGRPLAEFIDPLLAFGQPDAREEEQKRLKLRTHAGRRIPVEVASTAIAAIAPELDRLIALRDVSDLVRVEANLKRAQLEAHFHATERARFAADWNHRLRTPVQTILSVLDLCANNTGNPETRAGIANALAAAKDIMNGLEASHAPQDGSTDAEVRPPAPDPALPAASHVLDILVVEDHPQNRALLCDLVVSLGHRAVGASCGEDAVARATEAGFDLILMDIALPGIDGVEAARLIRQSEGPSHRATICAVSAHSRMLDAPRLLAAGMDKVIPKPLRRDALAHLIAGVASPGIDLPEPPSDLDRDVLDELVEQIGADRVVELFEGLFLEAQSAIDAARAWLANGNPEGALNEAHRTAGLAGLVGAQDLLGALGAIETSAARDDRTSGAEAVRRCEDALGETRRAWERFD